MWDDWNLGGHQHRYTFDHPEQYDFVDVSQNTHKSGSENWDGFLFVKNYLSSKPRPVNTIKTYGADGNKFGDSGQDGIERFWRHLLGGAAAIRFHRPDAGLGLNDKAMACIETARKIESMLPFWTLRPDDALLLDASENSAYVAADLGQSYVVYFPDGGGATLAYFGCGISVGTVFGLRSIRLQRVRGTLNRRRMSPNRNNSVWMCRGREIGWSLLRKDSAD